MSRLVVKFKQIVLLLGDGGVFYAALALALKLRNVLPRRHAEVLWAQHLVPFTLVFALWIVIIYLTALYDLSRTKNSSDFYRRGALAFGVNALLALAFFYLLPFFGIEPRTTLFLVLLLAAALWALWRTLVQGTVISRALRTRVFLIGENDETAEITRLLADIPTLGYDIVGRLDHDFDHLPELLKTSRANLVVLALSPRTHPELARPLYESIFLKVGFLDVIPFYEQITNRVPVSAITRVWFLENLREVDKRMFDFMKRGADVLLALLIGAATAVIGPFITLAIRLDSPGRALFRQQRIGKDGKIFKIVKFRTMRQDAETDGAQWAQKNDDRVTRIGRILRATRLDELPQVWNVFRGEMSFIGPRPERPEFVKQLTDLMPFYPMRHLVRPGLTGWAQVNYGYAATTEENLRKLQYDLFYIKNRSPFTDLIILLRTLGTVLTARGQ